jgi:phage terminase large subunit-like protein
MVAMDLSVCDDFSVVVYNVYNRPQKKFFLWLDCYIPEEALKEHANKELYKVWVENGWLKVCPGAVISQTMIVEDVLMRNRQVTILQIGYDAYKAQEVVNALSAAVAAEGGNPEKILRPVPQTYGAFTSPVETFEMAAKVVPARVQLCMNPIFPYCFGNCYLDEDKMRNKKPLKRKENLKIDAAIASLMTFWLYNNYEQ